MTHTHIHEWLNMKFGQDQPAVIEGKGKRAKEISPAIVAPTVKERLAELVFKNGGFTVTGWGMKQHGVGIYGEVGLDAEGAFDLMHLSGILVGFTLALSLDKRTAYEDVMTELKRVWSEKGWTEE